MSPMDAIYIGAIAGVFIVFAVSLIDKLKLDDPVGAIAVHLICGIWGTLAVGIFGDLASGSQFVSQLIGIGSYAVFCLLTSFIIIFTLKKTMGIRVDEKEELEGTFAPIDVLDYIYAVLHSPTYRETYKEFLKIDFPRVPYPKDADTFWELVKLGSEIRQIHLLESPAVEDYITQYPEDGDNVVTRKMTKNNIGYEAITDTHGKVWINNNQYFDNVPLVAWEFFIGGYQPAQKWLKDRKDKELSFEDILHYQKIIVATDVPFLKTHCLIPQFLQLF